MLVKAMIKGYTGCCGNGKRNELFKEEGQRRGFTEMPQTHLNCVVKDEQEFARPTGTPVVRVCLASQGTAGST